MTELIQRPLRGCRISSFYPVKCLPSLTSLDSAFQLQEYISLLIRLDVHDVDTIVSLPGTNAGKAKHVDSTGTDEGVDETDGAKKSEKKNGEVMVDEACWIYEQLRRLAQDLTHPLITTLQQECTRLTCPQMKAGEWLYLCVAHGNEGTPERCCAIDYILHILDSATALLNSPRAFPSRMQIPPASHRHFSSLARRMGRIFAHAYFHHREAFEQAEAESSLYARFLALTAKFDLVPNDFLVIPPQSGAGTDSRTNDPPRLSPEVDRLVSDRTRSIERGAGSPGAQRLADERISGSPVEVAHGLGLGVTRSMFSVAESPRKLGRSRTDTMVHHDLSPVGDDAGRFLDADLTKNVDPISGAAERHNDGVEAHVVDSPISSSGYVDDDKHEPQSIPEVIISVPESSSLEPVVTLNEIAIEPFQDEEEYGEREEDDVNGKDLGQTSHPSSADSLSTTTEAHIIDLEATDTNNSAYSPHSSLSHHDPAELRCEEPMKPIADTSITSVAIHRQGEYGVIFISNDEHIANDIAVGTEHAPSCTTFSEPTPNPDSRADVEPLSESPTDEDSGVADGGSHSLPEGHEGTTGGALSVNPQQTPLEVPKKEADDRVQLVGGGEPQELPKTELSEVKVGDLTMTDGENAQGEAKLAGRDS